MENKIFRPFVEVNLTEHCNISCLNCDHYSPYMSKKFISTDKYKEDLSVLSTVLHANHLLLLGGEPLLHPELEKMCVIGKKTGIANQIVLVTNGLLLHKMSETIWSLIDGIRISIYPQLKINITDKSLRFLSKKHDVWIWKNEINSFRKNALINPVTDKDVLNNIYQNCLDVQLCNTIYEGRFYRCPPPFLWRQG